MHELGITAEIVSIVTAHAAERKVSKVRLEIGMLSMITPDAVRFCFDVCSKGTLLEGAELTIDEIAGLGRCSACGRELSLGPMAAVCSCGSIDVVCIAGTELRVKEMEVVDV